jgi:hypothetical protein
LQDGLFEFGQGRTYATQQVIGSQLADIPLNGAFGYLKHFGQLGNSHARILPHSPKNFLRRLQGTFSDIFTVFSPTFYAIFTDIFGGPMVVSASEKSMFDQ